MDIFGSIGNSFDRMIKQRKDQAELDVHAYLASLDDGTLNRIGIRRSELRKGGRSNFLL